MKDLKLLIWLTQLGLSVAIPPVLIILLTLWLHDDCGWGDWVVWVGIALGIFLAINTLLTTLKAMAYLLDGKREDAPPSVSNNDHI